MANKIRWKTKWPNMFAHQRADVLKQLGVTSEVGLKLLTDKKYEELDESLQIALKHL